jgi:hypothetical protein
MTHRLSTALALTILCPLASQAEFVGSMTTPDQNGVTITTTIDTTQNVVSFEFDLASIPYDYEGIGFSPSPLPAFTAIALQAGSVISSELTEWNFHPVAASSDWTLELQYGNASPPLRLKTVVIHYRSTVTLTGTFLRPVGDDNIQVTFREPVGGFPDGQEDNVTLWAYTPELAPPDSDGDGITDVTDNCTEIANADQRDSDADGYGNMCDGDLNNDGFTDGSDLQGYSTAHRTAQGDPGYTPDADFNGAGFINTLDLRIYNNLHGSPPGPSSCCGG